MRFSGESGVLVFGGRRAFSLIEIMTVLTIIAVLAAIGSAVVPGVLERGRERRATADMQVIQQGLEAYRARFGDYPKVPTGADWEALKLTDGNAYLLNALNGRIGPTGKVVHNVPSMLNNSLLVFEKAGLPLSKVEDNRIVDPWGEAYVYEYNPDPAVSAAFGYKLWSKGRNVNDTEDDVEAR